MNKHGFNQININGPDIRPIIGFVTHNHLSQEINNKRPVPPTSQPQLPTSTGVGLVLFADLDPFNSIEYFDSIQNLANKLKKLTVKREKSDGKLMRLRNKHVELQKALMAAKTDEGRSILRKQDEEVCEELYTLDNKLCHKSNIIETQRFQVYESVNAKIQTIATSITKHLNAAALIAKDKNKLIYLDPNYDITKNIFDQLNWEYMLEQKASGALINNAL